MSRNRNWLKELQEIATNNNAILLFINYENINNFTSIKQYDECEFICNCGVVCNKTIRKITRSSGCFCEKCSKINQLNKKKKTCLKKYGVEYAAQNEIVKEKCKKTCLEKYGVEYSWQSVEVKEKIKKSCLENWGVEHVMQNKTVKEKQSKNMFKKKNYKFNTNQVVEVMGHEDKVLKTPEGHILDKLQLHKICCRRHMLTHVDIE